MRKILNLFSIMIISTFIIGVFESCGHVHESTQLQDLKAEVILLESQVNAKQEDNTKLKERIAWHDEKITEVLKGINELKERCP
jgi:outer membrane murein-binding lipoprotein Lpp